MAAIYEGVQVMVDRKSGRTEDPYNLHCHIPNGLLLSTQPDLLNALKPTKIAPIAGNQDMDNWGNGRACHSLSIPALKISSISYVPFLLCECPFICKY